MRVCIICNSNPKISSLHKYSNTWDLNSYATRDHLAPYSTKLMKSSGVANGHLFFHSLIEVSGDILFFGVS